MNVQDYWDFSNDDLYEMLGASLLGVGIGISPEDRDNHRRFGKQWFARQYGELQRRICDDKRVRELTGTTVSDRFVDAAAIVELLSQHDDYRANAALIAVLVARIGLGAFCANVKAGS